MFITTKEQKKPAIPQKNHQHNYYPKYFKAIPYCKSAPYRHCSKVSLN